MAYDALSWAELKQLPEDELIKRHDESAVKTVRLEYYLEELRHRSHLKVSCRIERLTWVITGLTVIVALATIYNVFEDPIRAWLY